MSDTGDQVLDESHEIDDGDDLDSNGNPATARIHLQSNKENVPQANAQTRMGFLSGFWPSGRRFFTALGLDRCTIL